MDSSYIQSKTKGIRHFLVKVLAPTMYRQFQDQNPPYRPMIKFVNGLFHNQPLVGAEIGVSEGTNSASIMNTLSMKKLYLIDPYTPFYEDGRLLDPTYALSLAEKKMLKFGEKVVFVKKKSSEAIDSIGDKLDFIYIDGNHEYESVKEDIELYYPLINDGGVIGGHDFSSPYFGVCKAVMEFASKNHLELKGERNDWWLVKTAPGKQT